MCKWSAYFMCFLVPPVRFLKFHALCVEHLYSDLMGQALELLPPCGHLPFGSHMVSASRIYDLRICQVYGDANLWAGVYFTSFIRMWQSNLLYMHYESNLVPVLLSAGIDDMSPDLIVSCVAYVSYFMKTQNHSWSSVDGKVSIVCTENELCIL